MMRPNHSFLGFVKNTPKDSSEGLIQRMRLQDKHMLSSSSLCKNKEGLSSNGGGKWERNIYSCIVRRQYVTGEHDTSSPLCLDQEIHLSLSWSYLIESLQFGFGSHLLVKFFQVKMLCHRYVQEKSNLDYNYLENSYPSIASAIPESILDHSKNFLQNLT